MRRQVRYLDLCLSLLFFFSSGNLTFAQNQLPDKPQINFATFKENTSKLTIDWNASTSKNVLFYKIYTLDISTSPVTGRYLDSVPADTLCYAYNPGTLKPNIYTITAVNNLGNESLLGGDFHKPVKLDIAYDSCAQAINLVWDKYYGWKNNLSGYRIFSKADDGDYSMIRELIDTSMLQYRINNIEENSAYKFYIEAFSNRGTKSMSVVRNKFTFMPPPPSYINLDYVTVIDDRTVEISFTPDLSGIVNDFLVSRSRSINGNYGPVQVFENVNVPTVTLSDEFVTQGEQFFYKVEALNSCQVPISSSNTANNVVLSGKASGSIITLTWSPYIEFGTGTSEYRVHRKNQYDEFEMIDYLDPEKLSFSEDISFSGNNTIKGEVGYYIEVLESGTNPMGTSGVSNSNEITVNVETKIYLPNAFTPNGDGRNDVFLPVFDFIPKEYKMFIYDRSGKLIFYSTDPNLGWEGLMNGRAKAPEGVYVFHVEYLSYNGIRLPKTGNLTLVYP
jgi:gliding motility-associated-like protein